MYDVALSLGSNSGDRFFYMRKMEEALQSVLLPPIKMSTLFKTGPVDVFNEQPWYLNRIIKGKYTTKAVDLFQQCLDIELQLGRVNKGMHTERTADIDILLFGNQNINTATLIVPHPAILRRRFCMVGLYQIMPDALVTATGKTISECFAAMGEEIRKQWMETVYSVEEQGSDE
jgi:2-amino-4-hydroxy-6-hydroxymethyldihydropteridine diphosphokinase